MEGITTTDHVIKTAAGAVIGGTILVALAPVLLPVAVFGGAAAAVTVGVGSVLGGLGGYLWGKPSEQQVVQLLQTPRIQGLMTRPPRNF